MKCVIVLESVFSDNKLSFHCFDCSPHLSVGSGCELESARAHKNFDIVFDFGWQPAQIHIRVHMRLAGTSLCQRWLLLYEILSAPNNPYHASILRRTVQISCQTLERLFLSPKGNQTEYFSQTGAKFFAITTPLHFHQQGNAPN